MIFFSSWSLLASPCRQFTSPKRCGFQFMQRFAKRHTPCFGRECLCSLKRCGFQFTQRFASDAPPLPGGGASFLGNRDTSPTKRCGFHTQRFAKRRTPYFVRECLYSLQNVVGFIYSTFCLAAHPCSFPERGRPFFCSKILKGGLKAVSWVE